MTAAQLNHLRIKLLDWFQNHKRDLPWRQNSNWYKTYLSEIILQQTTVDQGLPYFQKFIKLYPNINVLAGAQEQNILLHWAGLGYYSRARNMLKCAKKIVNNFNGEFPQEHQEALQLPGIGPYSAAAILSISFGQHHPVVDGNVIRVISRLYSIKDDTRQASTHKEIFNKAEILLDEKNPGMFNEAIMELGALICFPKTPACNFCPLSDFCSAYKNKLIDKIPFKSKPAAKHKNFQLSSILKYGSKVCIVRKPTKGLLAGMWEFPSLNMKKNQFSNGFSDLFIKEYGIKGKYEATSPNMRHLYTHIDLTYKAVTFTLSDKTLNMRDYVDLKWIDINDINNYAVHNAQKKVLDWYINADSRN